MSRHTPSCGSMASCWVVQASEASCEVVTVRVRPVGGRVRLIAAANSSTGSGPSTDRIRTAILNSPRSAGLTLRAGSLSCGDGEQLRPPAAGPVVLAGAARPGQLGGQLLRQLKSGGGVLDGAASTGEGLLGQGEAGH